MNRREFLYRSSASVAAAGVLSGAGCAVSRTDGGVALRANDLAALEKAISGHIIQPDDASYDSARIIWNACIDRRPLVIARPATTRDVSEIVRFAYQNGVSLSVRGGGHNHNGYAVSDGGIMMDMSALNQADLRPEDKSVVAQSGMTWGAFDAVTHQASLATTGAIVSMVGVPGYTLGGGIGWLHRKFGAGCDNLIGAEVVLPTGEVVKAAARENEDLLWALRGGGGNFGVATKLHFRLHELSDVYAGLIFYPLDDLGAVGDFLDGYLEEAPDDLNVWMLHRMAPPSPLLPQRLHGKPVLILAVTWTGGDAQGERMIAPLLKIGSPIESSLKKRAYPGWQSSLDGAWGDGFCNEWVGGYLNSYDSRVREIIAEFVNKASSPISDVKVARLGGAFSRVGAADSAFGHRNAKYAYVIQTRWPKTQDSRPHLVWTQRFHNALRAVDTGGVYVNFIGKEEPPTRVNDAYEPEVFARLRKIKSEIDPHNFFSQNANIIPTGQNYR